MGKPVRQLATKSARKSARVHRPAAAVNNNNAAVEIDRIRARLRQQIQAETRRFLRRIDRILRDEPPTSSESDDDVQLLSTSDSGSDNGGNNDNANQNQTTSRGVVGGGHR